jgi:hypothetical protein
MTSFFCIFYHFFPYLSHNVSVFDIKSDFMSSETKIVLSKTEQKVLPAISEGK